MLQLNDRFREECVVRRLTVPILILSLSGWMLSAGALAKGVPFKGYVVESSRPIAQTTGNCPCNMNTFTIGAKPGTLRVTAVLTSFGLAFTSVYGIRLRLYAGKNFVVAGQAACRTSQKRCNQAVTLKT